MGKRVSHDATQEVSSSQLVPDAKPPVYGNVPKNDASMWLSAPVSADDFVGAPKKKRQSSGGRGIVIGLSVVALLAVTGGGVWYSFLREQPKQTSAFDPTPAPAPAQAPAVAAETSDAGVAVGAADAAVAATADAGAPVAAFALQADAVSAADPAVKKPAKKRAPTKKKVVKKKTAAKRR